MVEIKKGKQKTSPHRKGFEGVGEDDVVIDFFFWKG